MALADPVFSAVEVLCQVNLRAAAPAGQWTLTVPIDLVDIPDCTTRLRSCSATRGSCICILVIATDDHGLGITLSVFSAKADLSIRGVG